MKRTNNGQGDLFGGAGLRDAGMSQASEAQEDETPGWHGRAYAAICTVARQQSQVHVDDVLMIFREQPRHFNAWGAVWMQAIRDGVIARTGTIRPCEFDPLKHKHNYPVYRSLLFNF